MGIRKCRVPDFNQDGRIGGSFGGYTPTSKDFALNTPYNQIDQGIPQAEYGYPDPAHPFGRWAEPWLFSPAWHSVTHRDWFGTDTGGDYMLQSARHFFAGPDPYDYTDRRACGRGNMRKDIDADPTFTDLNHKTMKPWLLKLA